MKKASCPLQEDEQFIVDACDNESGQLLQGVLEEMSFEERTRLFAKAAKGVALPPHISRVIRNYNEVFRIRAKNALSMRGLT